MPLRDYLKERLYLRLACCVSSTVRGAGYLDPSLVLCFCADYLLLRVVVANGLLPAAIRVRFRAHSQPADPLRVYLLAVL